MADGAQAASSGRPHIAAAGGVLAGAGLSTGLFGTLGVAKILSTPTGYSTAYPLVIFCLAALFLLTAALMTLQINRDQRLFAFVGMGCFAFTALAGVMIIFWQDFRQPTITLTEMFEPSDVFDHAAPNPPLRVLYRSAHSGAGEFAPYKNSQLSVTGGDVISFRMDGLSDLVQQYNAVRSRSDTQAHFLVNACKAVPTNELCQQISYLNAPS